MKDYMEKILAILGLLLPFIYKLIVAKNPELPIPENVFVEMVLYIIMAIAGYRTKAIVLKWQKEAKEEAKKKTKVKK